MCIALTLSLSCCLFLSHRLLLSQFVCCFALSVAFTFSVALILSLWHRLLFSHCWFLLVCVALTLSDARSRCLFCCLLINVLLHFVSNSCTLSVVSTFSVALKLSVALRLSATFTLSVVLTLCGCSVGGCWKVTLFH